MGVSEQLRRIGFDQILRELRPLARKLDERRQDFKELIGVFAAELLQVRNGVLVVVIAKLVSVVFELVYAVDLMSVFELLNCLVYCRNSAWFGRGNFSEKL